MANKKADDINNCKLPKYMHLREYIINLIKEENFIPGDKIQSENELAEKFSISRHTVRQALSTLVNEGWLYKTQGKGTFVDRKPNIKKVASKTISVITTYLDDYIFPKIIKGIDDTLSKNGYTTNLSYTNNTHVKERECLEGILSRNIDGLIVEPSKSAIPNPNIELYKKISLQGIPILFIHALYHGLDYSYIVEDDEYAGYLAGKSLIEAGHKNIAGIFKVDDLQGHKRFKGFLKAHKEAGLKVDDSKILWYDTNEINQMKTLLHTEKIMSILENSTGLVSYNDQISLLIKEIISVRNIKIPEDLSLISFDDSYLATASELKLTSISHPKYKLGVKAGEIILKMISGEGKYYGISMKPEIIFRDSIKNMY